MQMAIERDFIGRSAQGRVGSIRLALSGGVGIVVSMAAGCGTLPSAAREHIIAANRFYESGNFAAARSELDPVIQRYPKSRESAEAYYIRARCAIRSEDRASAAGDLERCLALSGRPELTALAHADLGDLAFRAEKYGEAISHFQAALAGLNEQPPADEVRYRMAISLQREGRWGEARSELAVLMHRYKGGRHAADVGRRFRWPYESLHFAIQCGVFRDPDSAAALVKKLLAARLGARSKYEGRDDGPMHVVYVGQFDTYAAARGALPGVKSVVPDALVVP